MKNNINNEKLVFFSVFIMTDNGVGYKYEIELLEYVIERNILYKRTWEIEDQIMFYPILLHYKYFCPRSHVLYLIGYNITFSHHQMSEVFTSPIVITLIT